TKAVLETGILVEDGEGYRLDGPLPPFAIPETLQDSLMARLDRLAPVKEIGQIGAAIGREFSYSLLRVLVGRDETALKHGLAQLEQAGLVFRRGEPPEAVYSFKHVLVRDAAYESLLKSRRQQLHGQIARTLEQSFADIVASQPEIVAHHFTEAGLVEPAIDYWLKAGQQAARRSAIADHLVNTAENVDDSVYKVLAHEALGFTLFARGEFAAAHAALERSLSMSEDSKAAAYLDLSAQDPRVHVRLYDGMVLWLLGYPDQALRICAEARRYADTSQHP